MPRPTNPARKPLGELALIELIRSRCAARPAHLRLGIGDDCAILSPPANHDLVVTTDFSLEGRHFRRDWHTPAAIGHRTLARGLSDLAAMGAKPLAAFLSLALPKSFARNPKWINDFLEGLLALASTCNTPLAGGDTAQSPSAEVLADIVLLGATPSNRALRRSTARPGDLLYVTGHLGGAAAELQALASSPRKFRKRSERRALDPNPSPHLFPQPRLGVGQALLRRKLATACIDISDSLSTDLAHLCAESQVAAELDTAAIPLHPLTASLADPLAAALHGGEDYELLFTARASTRVPRSIAGVAITCIGRILPTRRNRPQLTLATGRKRSPLTPQGWEHFQ